MGMLRPPDFLFLILPVVASVLVIWLGYSILEEDGWRVFLFLAIPVIHTASTMLWWGSQLRFRIWGYRHYYRFFGPICTVKIIGRLQVDADICDDEFLNRVYSLVKRFNSKAKVDISIDNRSVIRVGAQVLTTTVITTTEECADEGEVEKSVSFDLGGYEGHVSSLDDALSHYSCSSTVLSRSKGHSPTCPFRHRSTE